MREGFDTTRRRGGNEQGSPACFVRYRPQIPVSILVVAALFGGAFYAARASEKAPKVVYSASLEEVASEADQPLKVNINTADIDELDELPQVGPSTAQKIVDYRRANGMFQSVDELASIANYKTLNLSFSAVVSDTGTERLELARV